MTIRAGAPAAGLAIGDLPLIVECLPRGTLDQAKPLADERIRVGDDLVLAGTADAFAQVAPLFRVGTLDTVAMAEVLADTRTVVDTDRPVELDPQPGVRCSHLGQITRVMPSARGCEDCLRTGDRWVHLRICMTCGHVGCCDSSPNRHATAHNHTSRHPIIKSLEPGENWGWCYPDAVTL